MHAALQQTRQTAVTQMTFEQLDGKAEVKGIERNEEPDGDRELKILENGGAGGETEQVGANEIDLRPYTNRSETAVPADFSAMRTYLLFRTLGLRHLPVVDEHNRVVGMVTRKELLSEALMAAMSAAGLHVGGH